MLIFPAIDLYEGKAVRLYKGDYAQMTVYSEDPVAVARDFAAQGAQCLHLVDLEGAKTGLTPNLETVRAICAAVPLFTELGGGVRSMAAIESCLDAGAARVILGTAAVTDPAFLREAAGRFGGRIAVGADVRDGRIAIRGWTERSELELFAFCRTLQSLGIRTLICTDVSRDGAMQGTNRELYRELKRTLDMELIASGGVSTLEDVRALRDMGLHGAIIGRAYYTGAVKLRDAIEVAK